jgi:hypothetical protein
MTADVKEKFDALEAEIAALKARVEYAEALAGIRKALDQADRGLGTPLKDVDARMRAKYGIPRK